MKFRGVNRRVTFICAAIFFLAGCRGPQGQLAPSVAQQSVTTSGSATQLGAPVATRQNAGKLRHASGSKGWTVSGRSILLDGKRFFIKGVDYGNTNAGYWYKNNGRDVNDAPVADPLDNAYEKIWRPDLDLMRADGVNAIKVYNVSLSSFKQVPGYDKTEDQHPSPGETGKIDEFLDAAWNGGNHPIYVVLSVFFKPNVPIGDSTTLKAYEEYYRLMDEKYGAMPAVMGVSISSEINAANLVRRADWWKGFDAIDAAAKKGFSESKNTERFTTTTFVDGVIKNPEGIDVEEGPYYGTKFKSTNDTWGLDVYRAPQLTPTHIWEQIAASTQKPMMLGEYGNPAAYFFLSLAKHGPQGHCIDYPVGDPGTPEDVDELPGDSDANPGMQYLVDWVTGNQTDIYSNYTDSDPKKAVNSGGFFFEFSDEWWKSGWSRQHIGGAGGKIPRNPQYASCYNSEAWFGLYKDKPVDAKVDDHGNLVEQPFPNGREPDKRVPRRRVVDALTALWAKE
jgi:hypothetical protein